MFSSLQKSPDRPCLPPKCQLDSLRILTARAAICCSGVVAVLSYCFIPETHPGQRQGSTAECRKLECGTFVAPILELKQHSVGAMCILSGLNHAMTKSVADDPNAPPLCARTVLWCAAADHAGFRDPT